MGAKVLVVDDEREFSVLLSERLRRRDYEAQFCFGGKEALEILGRRPCDVIVLDLVMPEMDGITTLKEIKLRYPLTEVILLSGRATLETAIQGMWMGAFEYLTKPCEIEHMTSKINEAYLRKFAQEERIRKAKRELELSLGQTAEGGP
jgi:DNA-binding NtrC family response regulator